MSSISCKCGSCTIKFPHALPLFAGECACVECLGQLGWCASKGGPEIPAEIVSKDKRLKLHYPHDKMVVTGKDKLMFTQVREDAASTNCIATCCHTVMVVDNAFYHQGSGHIGSIDGSGFVMFFESITPSGAPAEIKIRWIFPASTGCSLPYFYLAEPGNFGTMKMSHGGDGFAAFSKAAATPAVEGEGQTFAQLLEESGSRIVIQPYS